MTSSPASMSRPYGDAAAQRVRLATMFQIAASLQCHGARLEVQFAKVHTTRLGDCGDSDVRYLRAISPPKDEFAANEITTRECAESADSHVMHQHAPNH